MFLILHLKGGRDALTFPRGFVLPRAHHSLTCDMIIKLALTMIKDTFQYSRCHFVVVKVEQIISSYLWRTSKPHVACHSIIRRGESQNLLLRISLAADVPHTEF